MKKLVIGILGGRGMLGSDLVEFLGENHKTTAIDKDNYSEFLSQEFDVLINANGNSRRFWANKHLLEDFEASTISVYKSLLDFKFGKYIYISSSDVYNNHSSLATTAENQIIDSSTLSPYGFHKYLSEQIVKNKAKDWLILRCSMILGRNLKKGPIYDILHQNPLFIMPESRIQLIPTREVVAVIGMMIERNISKETFNVGGRGAFSFKDIGRYFSQSLTLAPEAETQEYEMNVSKLDTTHPLKKSEEYLKDFLYDNDGIKKQV